MPIDDLETAFTKWLHERRDDLNLRQQFWLAWKAGAEWALAGVRKGVGLPDSSEQRGKDGV